MSKADGSSSGDEKARVRQLRELALSDPDSPSADILDEDEWRVLWALANKRPPSEADGPLTNLETVRMIARLGGHLGRKCDGMPGERVVMRGMHDLSMMVIGYRAAQ